MELPKLDDELISDLTIDGIPIDPCHYEDFRRIFRKAYMEFFSGQYRIEYSTIETPLRKLKKKTSEYVNTLAVILSSSVNSRNSFQEHLKLVGEIRILSRIHLNGLIDYLLHPFGILSSAIDYPSLIGRPIIKNITEHNLGDWSEERFKACYLKESVLMSAFLANRDLLACIDVQLDMISILKEKDRASKPKKGSQGRNSSPGLDVFITTFSEFYETLGGKLSANYVGQHVKGKRRVRGGKFVGFMNKINAFLPNEIRFQEPALGERIALLLRNRKNRGK